MDEAKWQDQYAKEDDEFRLFACALKISVSYAASIGGTGTLIGSGPNIVLKGQAEGCVKYQFLVSSFHCYSATRLRQMLFVLYISSVIVALWLEV